MFKPFQYFRFQFLYEPISILKEFFTKITYYIYNIYIIYIVNHILRFYLLTYKTETVITVTLMIPLKYFALQKS